MLTSQPENDEHAHAHVNANAYAYTLLNLVAIDRGRGVRGRETLRPVEGKRSKIKKKRRDWQ